MGLYGRWKRRQAVSPETIYGASTPRLWIDKDTVTGGAPNVTAWPDKTSWAHNLTVSSSPTYPTLDSYGVVFDGTNWAAHADTPDLDITDRLIVCVRFKTTNAATAQALLTKSTSAGSGWGAQLGFGRARFWTSLSGSVGADSPAGVLVSDVDTTVLWEYYGGAGGTNADRLRLWTGAGTEQSLTYYNTIPASVGGNSYDLVVGAWSNLTQNLIGTIKRAAVVLDTNDLSKRTALLAWANA